MGLTIFQNLAGTLRSTFRLGRNGPTLRQGTSEPNSTNVAGNDGDIFIQCGDTAQSFYQKRGGKWVELGQGGGTTGIKRKVVTAASYNILQTDHYIGVNFNGAVDLYLPSGTAEKSFIVKDESGAASSINSITIHPATGETIDGAPNLKIDVARSSITMVFGAEWHII